MSSDKKITVLMPVYNTKEEWLRASIESILKQSIPDFEFLIILDAPTDNSIEIVHEYAKKDQRIIIKENNTNIGLTKSLNKGIKYASGMFITRMDSDDIACETRLEEELEYLLEHKLEFIGSRINRIDENDNEVGSVSEEYNDDSVGAILKYVNCIPHPTWFLYKTVYEKLNGYRDISTCEDYDFLLRAQMKGIRIGLCDKVLLKYRINTSGITRQNSLKQFLTTYYLQNNIDHIEQIDQKEINCYLEKKINEKENLKFERATAYSRTGVSYLKKGKTLQGMRYFFKALATSKNMRMVFNNALMVRRISNR